MRSISLILAVLCASAAHAALGDQLFKLLPGDGETGDNFGRSVAISGTTAVVGAPADGDNGIASQVDMRLPGGLPRWTCTFRGGFTAILKDRRIDSRHPRRPGRREP
jgi:hypothetical protein